MKDQDYIYAVYKERSFSGAAKKLYVSQPALSMAVKKTEEELGITIFDRSTSPLTLTDEGKIYIQAIEEIQSAERTMKDRLSDMANLRSGHVSVSGENFVSSFILPEVLLQFSRKYSGIDVELMESNFPDLRQLLLSESIDLLVAHDFDLDLYSSVELFEEDVLLAVPDSFAVNSTLSSFAMTAKEVQEGKHKTVPPVDLSLFANEDFLILKPGNDLCRRAGYLCSEAGFQPKTRIRLDQLITAYNLAGAGMGVTFVSDILVEKTAVSGCLYYRLESYYAHRKMSIGYKRNRYLNRSTQAFIETAKEVFAPRRENRLRFNPK